MSGYPSGFPPPRKPNKKELAQAEDYHKMKDFYYDRYMSQLRDKILALDDKPPSATVHKNLRQDSNSGFKKGKRNATSREQMRRPVNKPLNISIPKSKRLTMLEAEQKLSKAGYLTSDDDLIQFRNGVAAAEDVEQYANDFAARKSSETNRQNSSKVKAGRPLSKIAETRENSPFKSSRPTSKAIAQKQMDTNLNPLSGNKKLSPSDIARAAAAALEKRCPRMDVPDLRCLRPEPADSDDEEEIARDEMFCRNRESYSSHVAHIRHMYQRAQANSAQAMRIFEGREDDILQHDRKSNVISDLTNLCETIVPATPQTEQLARERVHFDDRASSTYDPSLDIPDLSADLSDTEGDNLTDVQEERVSQWRQESQQPANVLRKPFNLFTPIEEEPATPPLDISADKALVPYTETEEKPVLALENGRPVTATNPLNLDEVQAELKVLESKSLSTYWPNYLHVGESIFARNKADATS